MFLGLKLLIGIIIKKPYFLVNSTCSSVPCISWILLSSLNLITLEPSLGVTCTVTRFRNNGQKFQSNLSTQWTKIPVKSPHIPVKSYRCLNDSTINDYIACYSLHHFLLPFQFTQFLGNQIIKTGQMGGLDKKGCKGGIR